MRAEDFGISGNFKLYYNKDEISQACRQAFFLLTIEKISVASPQQHLGKSDWSFNVDPKVPNQMGYPI